MESYDFAREVGRCLNEMTPEEIRSWSRHPQAPKQPLDELAALRQENERLRTRPEIVVLVRCVWCMCVHKRYDAAFFAKSSNLVFIPSTLEKWAKATCEQCGGCGMEIYAGDEPEEGQG